MRCSCGGGQGTTLFSFRPQIEERSDGSEVYKSICCWSLFPSLELSLALELWRHKKKGVGVGTLDNQKLLRCALRKKLLQLGHWIQFYEFLYFRRSYLGCEGPSAGYSPAHPIPPILPAPSPQGPSPEPLPAPWSRAPRLALTAGTGTAPPPAVARRPQTSRPPAPRPPPPMPASAQLAPGHAPG